MQFTISELWAHMGVFARLVVLALLMMSVLSLVLTIERVMMFGRTQRDARRFAIHIGSRLAAGDLDATLDGQHLGDLGRVIRAGLLAFKASESAKADLVFELTARALERQSQREMTNLKRGLGLLATIGSTAPFVGLLGTVMGIVNSFQSIALSGSGGLATVSGGIAEALVTTAFGLLVAIPAVMAYNSLHGWVEARAVDVSEGANEFLDLVVRKVSIATEQVREAADRGGQ